ncbi:MAG: hypothetical protein LCH32_10695 [Bacteroidetes bacterium]|nr:hypothetical protein [Bacteroidota bacterium]
MIASIAFSLSLSAKVIYIKTKGGWFGYKNVIEYTTPSETVMTCSNPGFSRCRPDFAASKFGGIENFNAIDSAVMNAVNESNRSGSIIFNNQFYIRYKYILTKDELEVEVFTIDEARAAGINI